MKTSHISQLCIALLSVLFIAVSCDKDTEPWSLAPDLTANPVTNITRTTATLSGTLQKVTVDGHDSEVQFVGFQYSKNSAFSEEQTTTVPAHTSGTNLSTDATGLDPNTDYYVRVVATSERTLDRAKAYNTAYSNVERFKTLENLAPVLTINNIAAADITENSVTVTAAITEDGGSAIRRRGFLYIEAPTNIEELTDETEGVHQITIPDLTNYTITGLTSSTRYAVCAYANNSVDYGFSEIKYFTTNRTEKPELNAVEIVGSTSAGTLEVQSSVRDAGTAAVTTRGFVYSLENTMPTLEHASVVAETGDNDGFAAVLNNLLAGQTYHIRAFATNSNGTGYSSESVDYVVPIEYSAPSVILSIAELDSVVYGRFMGVITNNGGAQIQSQGFVISRTNELPTIGAEDCEDIYVEGTSYTFETRLRLEENTTYFVRAFAKNLRSEEYGYSSEDQVGIINTGILQIIPGQGDNPYPGTEGGQDVGGGDNPYPETGSKKR